MLRNKNFMIKQMKQGNQFKQFNFFNTHYKTLINKFKAPPMVYISGEEYTRYACELYLNEWIRPFVDTSNWEFYDLSCKHRDNTDDKVLTDCIEAGRRVGSIFKEPTITPTEIQKKSLGLKNTLRSPNGKMRDGWNGISISRDTIHIEGMELGYKNPVLFDRHAVGGEYGAGYETVGSGVLRTVFIPKGGQEEIIVEHKLTNKLNAVVLYTNPYDNITELAHHFFSRCLEANVIPYVVTKKNLFKWQEPFWNTCLSVFNSHYKKNFLKVGLLKKTGGELKHLYSDDAIMKVVSWTQGGFGMVSHNYDGDVLTDEIAQVHRSPGFLNSVLNGRRDDGSIIKEFEASHGTVTDMWDAHLRKEEASLNPLGLIEALCGAMDHSAKLYKAEKEVFNFTNILRKSLYTQMITKGKATRDLSGPNGLTTEQFVVAVKRRMLGKIDTEEKKAGKKDIIKNVEYDIERMREIFKTFDLNGDNKISFSEFELGIKKLRIEPFLVDDQDEDEDDNYKKPF